MAINMHACVGTHTSCFVCVCAYTHGYVCETSHTLNTIFGPTVAAGLESKFLVCINVLYVLVPVLVHVLLDGSGHDSAEIDGTVERHATSAPTKQPAPAPRHSTRSSVKTDFHLDLRDTSYTPYSPKHKAAEQSKPLHEEQHSPERSSPKSKIPVKIKKTLENETAANRTSSIVISETAKLDREGIQATAVSPIKRTDKTSEESPEKSSHEKEEREAEGVKEISGSPGSKESKQAHRPSTDVVPSVGTFLPEKQEELETSSGVVERTETVTITEDDGADPTKSSRTVTKETRVIESLPIDSTVSTTVSRTERDVTDETVSNETVTRTVTTVRCVTTGSIDAEEIMRTMTASGGYGDMSSMIEQVSTKIVKSSRELPEPWAHGSLAERSFLNDEKAEQWESQFSQDTSPGSGNGDIYTKNGSSRHDLNSDTDSDGSPRPRRRSSSKRRTLGSSSGSDVALHEGAELSPLEDDQGTALTANLLSKQCTYPLLNQVHPRGV